MQNIRFMKQMAADDCGISNVTIKATISEMIFNQNFLNAVNKLYELLSPVSELILNFQRENCSIADAVEHWLDFFAITTNEIRELAMTRCDRNNVFNKFALAANVLHPLYRGQKLSIDQQDVVENFIDSTLENDALNSYAFYRNEGNTFFIS